MAVFKPKHTRPLPEDAPIHTERKSGKKRKYIEATSKRGKKSKAYVTADGKSYLCEQKKWAGFYRDYHGIRRKISLCTDKTASELALGELHRLMELLGAGRSIPPIDEIAPIIRKPVVNALEESGQGNKTQRLSKLSILGVHLEDYMAHLESKGTTHKHRKEVKRCIKTLVEGCVFRTMADIALGRVEEFVIRKKGEGVSDRTTNVYTDRLRYFVLWAIERRIIEENPLTGLKRRDEKTNRVREARPLSPDEIEALLESAYNRPLEDRAGQKLSDRTIRKLRQTGQQRRLIYSLMLYTGLRVNEVRSLKWSDVEIGTEKPFLSVRAKITKNSKSTTLPLHTWLVSLLKEWKGQNSEVEASDSIVKVPTSMLRVFDRDCKAAGINKEVDGKVVHLHACRHSFITMLARQGAQPHITRKLARHSKMDMTMGVYTHIVHGDDSIAIEALPIPQQREVETRATGTDDRVATSKAHVRNHVHGGPNHVRNHVQSAGLTRDQKCTFGNKGHERAKSSKDSKPLNERDLGNKKAPLSLIVSEGEAVGGTGLEPVASCVSSRRSSQLS